MIEVIADITQQPFGLLRMTGREFNHREIEFEDVRFAAVLLLRLLDRDPRGVETAAVEVAADRFEPIEMGGTTSEEQSERARRDAGRAAPGGRTDPRHEEIPRRARQRITDRNASAGRSATCDTPYGVLPIPCQTSPSPC